MSLFCSLRSIPDAFGCPLCFTGAWMAEPDYEHRDPGVFPALVPEDAGHALELPGGRMLAASVVVPDSCVHLCLPSFPIYQRELREQDKCSHSINDSASFLGPGDFLSLDFVFAEEVQLQQVWAGHLCQSPPKSPVPALPH